MITVKVKSPDPIQDLKNKKLFFASDFHLGVPDRASSMQREKKIVRWLDSVKDSAHSIYLLGDVFDFWFEYKHAIPKGFVRLLGKLAEIRDTGIPITFFTGNHDMWMFDYFPTELEIPVYKTPQQLLVGDRKLLIGHGDGLGPGDNAYKRLKKIFESRLSQWLFARFHPNFGISLANKWSNFSRISNTDKEDEFLGEKEFLYQYCKEVEKEEHHDFYVFGHRHMLLEMDVGDSAKYINLGDWVNYCTYGQYDGREFKVLSFQG